ncbi:MAG: hypothetical protein KJN92_12760 [Gemmatimonadetes bacterium]|nr:hypothetical protein [Gemmatimonadota bacterium]
MGAFVRLIPLALSSALFAGPDRLSAQDQPVRPTWAQVGFSVMGAQSTGELSESNAFGLGLEVAGRVFWGGSDRLALRVSVGVADYGWDGGAICIRLRIACPVHQREITNSITFLELGPELSWPTGNVRPYLNASVGFAGLGTSERIKEAFSDFVLETGLYSHNTSSLGVGGGVDVKVGKGQNPLVISFGVQYHRFGWVRHLPREAVVENPDGSYSLSPVATRANLITYRVGAAVRVPG